MRRQVQVPQLFSLETAATFYALNSYRLRECGAEDAATSSLSTRHVAELRRIAIKAAPVRTLEDDPTNTPLHTASTLACLARAGLAAGSGKLAA